MRAHRRRTAGDQQTELIDPLIKQWNARTINPTVKAKEHNDFQFSDHQCAEVWRMPGSLERLPIARKITTGGLQIRWIDRKGQRKSSGTAVWELGRDGARVPTNGPVDTVLPPGDRWTLDRAAGRIAGS